MKTEKDQFCDVVMKGGVTSGIVYPLAICELAQTYTFKNIGGTSAGAIAAALAAAAEYRRRTTGSNAGFDELAKLPDELSNGALERLFQPQRKTKSLYRLVLCFIGSSPWWWKLLKALGLLFVRFPIGTVLGLLPGIFILVYLRSHLVRPITWCAWAWLGLLLLFLPAFILALLNVVVQALAAIPANNYGLCGGSGGKSDNKPLTDWLSDKIGFIADKKDLSFKDLWSAGGTPIPRDTTDQDERAINLEMMTTNLTFGRPYRLPFTDDETHRFYFRESEFRHLFPPAVVEQMKQSTAHDSRRRPSGDYLPFPHKEDVPIIVATRMSLSFPILISAVPLYTFDPTSQTIRRCLFSDGGISSNFPIHFFDSPVPRWPTFAITLSSSSENRPPDMVSLSQCNRPDQEEDWNRFDDHWWRLGGFLGAIFNTMENWRDQTQARVPGYRDRIATVYLQRHEGGLNLNMPTEVVESLSQRGQLAGARLRKRFDPKEGDGSGLNWVNQRWIRYRSFMAVFEEMLAKFRRGFEYPQVNQVPSYDAMVKAGGIGNPIGPCDPGDKSPFNAAQTLEANKKTQALLDLARAWDAAPGAAQTFLPDAPKPPADLVIRPKV